jgi:hypothetical protein
MRARAAVSFGCLLLAACSGEITAPAFKSSDHPAAPPTAATTPVQTQTAEGASARCRASQPGPPLLRRLTRAQIDNSLRDIFPDAAGDWQGFNLSDVSSALGFSNDATALVVSPQTADEVRKSAEQLASVLSNSAHLGKLLPCAQNKPDDSCARELITTQGQRLFRRPLESDEVARYLQLLASVSGASDFANGVKWTLTAMIQSPNMLYRRELGDLDQSASELSAYELATELSYTFADTTPDAALLERAQRGELDNAEVRVKEARRLLETARGHEMLQQFFREWLRYAAVRTADRPAIDGFDAIRGKLLDETARFIDDVAYTKHGGLRELLTAPYTFADAELAKYYDFPSGSAQWQSMARPDGRGIGILAQGALLASAANVDGTSPTHRGLLVYERLLCRTKPKPPANVPPLGNSDRATYRTTRQHYELAHAQGFCASCHTQFDPLGFAFEHFDQGGRYREDEAGEPIDASGKIPRPDGSILLEFGGAEELASRLADAPEVIDCVSGLLVQYAFGGAGGASCVAEEARASWRDGTTGFVETLAQLAAAPHFSQRVQDESMASPLDAGTTSTPDAGTTSTPDASTPAAVSDAAMPAVQDDTEPATDIGITAQYQASNAVASDNVIGPFLQITNASAPGGVALASLTLRYYFTNEHAALCPDGCMVEGYYSGIHPTGMGVAAKRRYVSINDKRAYLEISFESGAPQLMPGQSVEVQQYFHTNPYETFDESDDYSFDAAKTTFSDSRKITVYRDGKRVWGEPPH